MRTAHGAISPLILNVVKDLGTEFLYRRRKLERSGQMSIQVYNRMQVKIKIKSTKVQIINLK